MRVAIIGYGVLAKQIESIFNIQASIIFDDFVSDAKSLNEYVNYFSDYKFIVAIGYKHLNLKSIITNDILLNGVFLKPQVHNSVFISNKTIINKGSIIYPMCNIDINVTVGYSCVINNSVTISHDTVVGNNSFIGPGVIVCGNVKIGDRVFIGAGSILTDGITIGNDVTIGSGSLINKNISNNKTVIGNPFKYVKKLNI